MSDALAPEILRGWLEVAAAAGELVDLTLVDAGRYDPSTGVQADSLLVQGVLSVGGPATYRQVEGGAATRGDRFIQVQVAGLPRAPRADDLVTRADGSLWKIRSTMDFGPIVEAIIGKA